VTAVADRLDNEKTYLGRLDAHDLASSTAAFRR
jgi:hypothetical protein